MTHFLNSEYKYQAGGSLSADAPTYIERQADTQLYQSLLVGEYCYVLNSRQMGKSSLRIRTMSKLQARGIECTEIELSGIGSQEITASQWYGGIIQELNSGFELKINRRKWLKEREDLSPVQRLSEFIETVLLTKISNRKIVIFIDEIDSVLSLKFSTDEFFALIRNCYDKRAIKPKYKRLSFVLLGVATPSDLIQDINAAPFNIGQAIELKGFQKEESDALAQGFIGKVPNPDAVLREILYWTGGQPFLTQKLCLLLSQEIATQQLETQQPLNVDRQFITQLVQSRIINNWEAQDEPEHLRTVRDRIFRNSNSSITLLKLYQKIRQKKQIKAKNCQEHLELRLSGLVNLRNGYLVVKNPIYQTVFNDSWVRQQLNYLEPNTSVLPLWTVLLASFLVTTIVLTLRSLEWLQPWELQAFDLLMRLRPKETSDPRILLVTITEEDVQSQPSTERQGASLSHKSLEQLLTKLESAQPIAIGLDIYRETPIKTKDLETNNLFAICHYGNPGVPPPPDIISNYQGFNNVLLDSDRILRRHLLAVDSAAPCQSKFAFSWQLATYYLAQSGIYPQISPDNYLQLRETIFKPLNNKTVAYQNLDASGHQILLNYRHTEKIAETVTLQEILSDSFNLDLISDRLILLGTVAPSFSDRDWRTPYSKGNWSEKTMSGVEIQAHMISQILSAVLDQRPLIWYLSQTGEFILIGFCSLAAGFLVWRFPSPISVIWVIGSAASILSLSCWGLFVVRGVWLPLVPSLLVVIMTGSSLSIYHHRCS